MPQVGQKLKTLLTGGPPGAPSKPRKAYSHRASAVVLG